MTKLRELATALDSNDNLKVYDIVNDTAAAMKVRQVTFMDNFTASETDGRNAWQVNFTLVEYLSIPEKKEQRKPQKVAVDQSAEGQPAGETTPPTNQEEQLTGAMAVLKKLDDALA
ncbi:hypothetical protein [Endozoicomonas sp. SESOKO4]|uniref:baseplate complex protein n=1 Tax=Endozoicomonas sp. SESOKO4 TaxID=2828745 RepID=UPI0021478DC4|nr:hypothetical protein [Endozoicomonas sp. SESOKO4]